MRRFYSEKFPKLSVLLYQATNNPEKIIAHNYLECIEDRSIDAVEEISSSEAKKITEWVVNGGHTPALESIYLGFNIRGMSKVVSHQIVRHRIGVSIGQRTQRANSKEYLGNFARGDHYVLPPSFKDAFNDDDELEELLMEYFEQAEYLYNEFVTRGISEDEARYLIPQCSETSMDFNIIFKALINTASTRLCYLMQGEMVEIFRLIKMAVEEWNPLLGSMLNPICYQTGRCNRNENNPTIDFPRGACHLTMNGKIPVRDKDNTFDLTKYSKDNSK